MKTSQAKNKTGIRLLPILLILLICSSAEIQAQTLHLIYAVNTQDSSPHNIGKSCEKDKANIRKVADQVSRMLNLKLSEHLIEGDLSSEGRGDEQLQNLRKNLRTGPDDIVWFYASAHGYNDNRDNRRDDFPDVQIFRTDFALSEIAQSFADKNPGLILAMADCCNNLRITERNIIPNADNVQTRAEPLATAFAKLFKSARGTVIASSSVKGQLSAGSSEIGGFFSSSFISALYEVSAENIEQVSWENVFEKAQSYTRRTAKSVGREQISQHKINVSYKNGESIPVEVAPVSVFGDDGK